MKIAVLDKHCLQHPHKKSSSDQSFYIMLLLGTEGHKWRVGGLVHMPFCLEVSHEWIL